MLFTLAVQLTVKRVLGCAGYWEVCRSTVEVMLGVVECRAVLEASISTSHSIQIQRCAQKIEIFQRMRTARWRKQPRLQYSSAISGRSSGPHSWNPVDSQSTRSSLASMRGHPRDFTQPKPRPNVNRTLFTRILASDDPIPIAFPEKPGRAHEGSDRTWTGDTPTFPVWLICVPTSTGIQQSSSPLPDARFLLLNHTIRVRFLHHLISPRRQYPPGRLATYIASPSPCTSTMTTLPTQAPLDRPARQPP